MKWLSCDGQVVRQLGRPFRRAGYAFYVQPNGNNRHCLCLRIAKRTVPLATQRNAVKRLIRESCQNYGEITGVGANILVTFGQKQDKKWKVDKAQMRKELFGIWQSINRFLQQV